MLLNLFLSQENITCEEKVRFYAVKQSLHIRMASLEMFFADISFTFLTLLPHLSITAAWKNHAAFLLGRPN